MQQLILVIHVLACVAIIGLVLLQQGKGSDIGAAFGSGASNTVFGSEGSSAFLLKLTASVVFLFFMTSLTLTYFSAQEAKQASLDEVPVEESQSWLPNFNEVDDKAKQLHQELEKQI